MIIDPTQLFHQTVLCIGSDLVRKELEKKNLFSWEEYFDFQWLLSCCKSVLISNELKDSFLFFILEDQAAPAIFLFSISSSGLMAHIQTKVKPHAVETEAY